MTYEQAPLDPSDPATWTDDEACDVLFGVWMEILGDHYAPYPPRRSLYWFLGRLTYWDIYEAMLITAQNLPVARGERVTRYFYGVCHGMLRQRSQQ